MRTRILPVADLLMAAAHADRHMEVEEIDRIEALLARILEPGATGSVSLPSHLRQHMEDFRPEDFSMETTVGPFLHEDTAFKRKLLEMVVSIHESDGELDFLEDTFVRELGFKLGLADDEYADLCLRFLEEEGEEDQADSPAETHGFARPIPTLEPADLDKTELVERAEKLSACAPTPVPAEGTEAEHEWSFEAVSTGSARPVLARAETATYASPGTWEGPPASSEPLPSVEDQALYELVFRTVDLFLSQHPALKLNEQQREEFAEGAWGAFSALVPKVRGKSKKKTAAKKKATKKTAAKKKAPKKTAAKKKAPKKTASKKKASKNTASKKTAAKKKAPKKTASKKTAAKKKATKKTAAKKKATKKTAAKKKASKKTAAKKTAAKKKASKKTAAKKKATKKTASKKKATKKTASKKKASKKAAAKKKAPKKAAAKKKATKKKSRRK